MGTLHLIPVILVLALVFAVLLAVSGFRTGGRLNPNPPEHLRPKTKCICNDIANHSPGGRCEACYKKGSVPRMRNPPMPPIITKESMRLSIYNANKAFEAYNKMKLEIDFREYGQDNFEKFKKENIEYFSERDLKNVNANQEPFKPFVYFLLDEIEKQKNKELIDTQLPKDRRGCNV